MAKTTRGPHTPVSNEPEERAPVGKAASRPPSEGKDPRATKTTAQGTEQVEGFMPQGSLEAAAAPMTAPDTGKLRPIAEASCS